MLEKLTALVPLLSFRSRGDIVVNRTSKRKQNGNLWKIQIANFLLSLFGQKDSLYTELAFYMIKLK